MENTVLVDYYATNSGKTSRVPMIGMPPLWAGNRNALREVLSIEYHANNMSSIWAKDDVLYAILLGGHGGENAYDDGQITITQLGSAQEKDTATGGWRQFKDQDFRKPAVRACVRALEHKTVFLLLGGKSVMLKL